MSFVFILQTSQIRIEQIFSLACMKEAQAPQSTLHNSLTLSLALTFPASLFSLANSLASPARQVGSFVATPRPPSVFQ